MCSEPPFDSVNRPKHYCQGRQHQPIDVIEDWGLDYHLGNAVKYIARAGRKGDAVEDLEKAIWYIQREIRNIIREEERKEQIGKVASVWGSVSPNPCDPPVAAPVPNNDNAVVVDTHGTLVENPPLDEADIFTDETRLRDVS